MSDGVWLLWSMPQSQFRQNCNAPLVPNTAAMVLRYLPEVQQHLTPPFPVWKHMRRNPYRKKKRQKKSIFIYSTTVKKNESARDFQQGQIWNDRSQKQKKNYDSHPLPRPVIILSLFKKMTNHFPGRASLHRAEPSRAE
jgi:hypothetical protein